MPKMALDFVAENLTSKDLNFKTESGDWVTIGPIWSRIALTIPADAMPASFMVTTSPRLQTTMKPSGSIKKFMLETLPCNHLIPLSFLPDTTLFYPPKVPLISQVHSLPILDQSFDPEPSTSSDLEDGLEIKVHKTHQTHIWELYF